MGLGSEFRFFREGDWRLFVRSGKWSPGLWSEILSRFRDRPREDHPQVQRFHYPSGEKGREFYLKIYHRSPFLGTLKDLFRDSKAFRALKQGEALSERGFHVPMAVAAGEERACGMLRRAFLLTLGIEGSALPFFLRDHYPCPSDLSSLRKKRRHLRQLAEEIRHLHRHGFVHGDLVAYNILVQARDGGLTFFYMDNDRTRRYPVWLPHTLWRRNLVQLNRFALPGISLADRMRFLRFYFQKKSLGKKGRQLALWVDRETRRRRLELQRAGVQVTL